MTGKLQTHTAFLSGAIWCNCKALALFTLAGLLGCSDGIRDYNGYGSDGTTSGNHFAIVGYYNDGEEEFTEVGVFKLDECRERAISEYNAINSRHERRAFSWFCKNTHSGRIDR